MVYLCYSFSLLFLLVSLQKRYPRFLGENSSMFLCLANFVLNRFKVRTLSYLIVIVSEMYYLCK